jgi:hypothetical protein
MKVTGYHTVEDRGNRKYVENNAPFKCERSDAWFGHGFYFWDTEDKWAHTWGKTCYRRKGKGYIICEAIINWDDDRCFDLYGNKRHQLDFRSIVELVKKNYTNGYEPSVTEVFRYIQKILPDFYDDFDCVRGYDTPNNEERTYYFSNNPNRNEYMSISVNDRVQICLFNLKPLSLHPIRIIYPQII